MRKLVCWCMMLLALAIHGGEVLAQNTSAQESRKARLEQEIRSIDRLLTENRRKSTSALSELTLIQKKIANRQALIKESDGEIARMNTSIRLKQREIAAIQARLDTLTALYGRLVKNAYKNRDSRVWYMHILASGSVGQAFHRFGYLKNFAAEMNSQARRIGEVREELELEKSRLEGLRAEAEKVRRQRQHDVQQLEAEEARSKQVVTRLKRDQRKYQGELAAKKRQVEALNREIAQIIRKASGGGKGAGKTLTEADIRLSSEFADNKGRLPWPVEGTVVESYGQHYHPVFKNVKLPFNNGVTIAVDKDAEVKAVFNGKVLQIGVIPGYNRCVLVQHGDYFTFYCKLKTVSVKTGDSVSTGQALGRVDTIGGEDQLHFQLWSGRNLQNPEDWLRRH